MPLRVHRSISMNYKLKGGWIEPVRRLPSPNCDERPQNTEIDLLVIHNISLPPGEYGGFWIDALFTNTLDFDADPFFHELREIRVSSHLLIDRNGNLTQYVPFHMRAWHTGESCFEQRSRCNDFSIGIELEGCDNSAYEEIQYQRLAAITLKIMAHYPLVTGDRVVGHCDIASQRKTDPGAAFDWQYLYRLLSLAK